MELTETFTFRGDRVRWGVRGDGPPLVLLHGTPFSSLVWRRIEPNLIGQRRVFVFDLVGYGRSDKRDGQDVSLGVQNDLFAELLDHWALDAPDVVAHDFGGTTALRTHLLNGREYRTLTLLDPLALSPWGSELVVSARQHQEVYAQLPPYIHEAVVRAYISRNSNRTLTDEEMHHYLDQWLGDVGQASFYRQIAQMDERYTDEIRDRLAEVRCPVSILWGRDDALIPVERAHELARLIPGAELRVIDGAGHLLQEDSPESVVATILRAIDAVPATM
ncbi:MAG: alpha/beta hydrolase [Ilumatobacteraceae bacterium]|nr:alpha/beta hydrolase [Ilumatobacteraceae bacterium]